MARTYPDGVKKVKHLRSAGTQTVDAFGITDYETIATKPSRDDVEHGELVMNYAAGNETLMLKNNSNQIVGFMSENKIYDIESRIVEAVAQETVDRETQDIILETAMEAIDETVEELGNTVSTLSGEVRGMSTEVGDLVSDVNGLKTKVVTKTYSQLKTMKDGGTLSVGQFYRITDYTATTTQENTDSAGHQFDIIVLATENNKFNENALAARHTGDTYFADCNLDAWQLKYSFDNDTDRFAWADDTNGKGVIYYMKDEFNNECPYDFKNIRFKRWQVTSVSLDTEVMNGANPFNSLTSSGLHFSMVDDNNSITDTVELSVNNSGYGFYYTFSTINIEETPTLIEDASIKGMRYSDPYCGGCANNVIKPYIETMSTDLGYDTNGLMMLNNIVLNGYYDDDNTYNACANTFGFNTYNITFGKTPFSNTICDNVHDVIFSNNSNFNVVGSSTYSVLMGAGVENNTINAQCDNITISDTCQKNEIGKECTSITMMQSSDHNTFGAFCNTVQLSDNTRDATFGKRVTNFYVKTNISKNIVVGSEVSDVNFSWLTHQGTLYNVEFSSGLHNINTGSINNFIGNFDENKRVVFQPSDTSIINV